eukprot:1592750-Pyramimonas_sp.AAC.2
MAEHELKKAQRKNKGKAPARNDVTLPRNKVAPAPRDSYDYGRPSRDVEEGPQLSPMYNKQRKRVSKHICT